MGGFDLCFSSEKMWVVVETYYKHGEYSLFIFKTESELREYILEELITYEYEITLDNEDIECLIEIVVQVGNDRVKEQEGWGVREIKKI